MSQLALHQEPAISTRRMTKEPAVLASRATNETVPADAGRLPCLPGQVQAVPRPSRLPAEVDRVHAIGGQAVPDRGEVGGTALLRSLHAFTAERDPAWAMRLAAAPPVIQDVEAATVGGTLARYALLSLPLYLGEETPRLFAETRAWLPRRTR